MSQTTSASSGITIKQVPVWGIEDNWSPGGPRGHIVMSAENRGETLTWARTACGSLFSSLTSQTEVPRRICRKCRQRLKDITPPPTEDRCK